WNSLSGSFIWDDQHAILTNRSIRQLWPDALFPPAETPVAGRPVANLSLALNYAIGGLDPTGFHLWNIAVHITNAILLFSIVRRTLARASPDASHPRDWSHSPEAIASIVALV